MATTVALAPEKTRIEDPVVADAALVASTNGAASQYKKRIPPLENGDQLTQLEFDRRYQAHPEIKKAELIEGVVYVASPVKVQNHGEPHANIVTWVGVYRSVTRGVRVADNSTYILDNDNEPQPDVTVWIDQKSGGQATVTTEDYLEGAPELVVEVAGSSAAIDLRQKFRAYRRKGILEYIVLLVHERETRWFRWHEGEYVPVQPDQNGVLKSQIFPGLWLDSEKFWNEDLAGLLATLQEGIASAEHQAFVERLTSSVSQ